jgi:hypothetical protein
MNIKSLKNKNYLIDSDGERYVDLSQPSILPGADVKMLGGYRVTSAEEMRLDLVCDRFYGSTEYMDVLMKANNIFNPFSIKEGDFLIIPDVQGIEKIYDKNLAGDKKKKELIDQFTDTSRIKEE